MRKLRNSEMNRLTTGEFKASEKTSVIVALDDVRSMHNVGSVFRTADAFRIREVILGGITPTPPQVEIEKTALGATDSVDWVHQEDLSAHLQRLKSDGYTVIALEQTDQSVMLGQNDLVEKQDVVLVFGNEVKGVSNKVLDQCDHIMEIPQFGTKHSLNISVSAGIAIWEFSKYAIKKGEL